MSTEIYLFGFSTAEATVSAVSQDMCGCILIKSLASTNFVSKVLLFA